MTRESVFLVLFSICNIHHQRIKLKSWNKTCSFSNLKLSVSLIGIGDMKFMSVITLCIIFVLWVAVIETGVDVVEKAALCNFWWVHTTVSVLLILFGLTEYFSDRVVTLFYLCLSDIFFVVTNFRKEAQWNKCLFLIGHWGCWYDSPYSCNFSWFEIVCVVCCSLMPFRISFSMKMCRL